MPSSIGSAASSWTEDPSPLRHQSITELLHDPRTTLPPPPPPRTHPAPPRHTINAFTDYLRSISGPHAAFSSSTSAPPPSTTAPSIPSFYSSTDFTAAHSPDLATLTLPHDAPALRETLARREEQLHAALHGSLTSDDATKAVHAFQADAAALRRALSAARAAALAARAAVTATAASACTAPDAAALGDRRANANVLAEALQRAQAVLDAARDAHACVDAADYEGAMRVVRIARGNLAARGGELGKVGALAHARAALKKAVERIDGALREGIRALIAVEVDAVVGEVDEDVRELARLVSGLGTSALAHRAFLEDVRKGLSVDLEVVNSLDEACAMVRAAGKRVLLVHDVFSVEGVGEEAEARRELDRKRNRDNLREVYDALLEMMCDVVDRIVGGFEGDSEFIVLMPESEVDEANFFNEAKGALRFGDIMRSVDVLVADLAQQLGGKLAEEGEARAGSGAGARADVLKAKLLEKSLSYVNALHRAHAEALTSTIHREKWSEVKVPVGVLRLVACLTGDTLPQAILDGVKSAGPTGSPGGPRRLASAVIVHDESFKAVTAGLRYVRSICAFALLVEKLPYAASEAARRGIELSRLFNALAGRAILGASALQWAGLRSITARHLALASRTVSLAIALHPHVCAPLQNAVVEAQVAVVGTLLQNTEKDLRDHHGQLLAKKLAIMMDRLALHEESLTGLPWTKSLEMARFEIPSPYATTLTKEVTMLHRILSSTLPSREMVDIFTRVCKEYGARLESAYSELDFTGVWVRRRVKADVAHLHKGLSALEALKTNPKVFQPLEDLYQKFSVQIDASAPEQPGVEKVNTASTPGSTIIRARPSSEYLPGETNATAGGAASAAVSAPPEQASANAEASGTLTPSKAEKETESTRGVPESSGDAPHVNGGPAATQAAAVKSDVGTGTPISPRASTMGAVDGYTSPSIGGRDSIESPEHANRTRPIEAVGPIVSSGPTEPSEPNELPGPGAADVITGERVGDDATPVGDTIGVDPVGGVRPVASKPPLEPSIPVESVKNVEPSEPLAPLEVAEPVVSSEPREGLVPPEPTEPSVPVQTEEPQIPVEAEEPLVQAEPLVRVQAQVPLIPEEPAEPAVPVEPAEPAEPAGLSEPAVPLAVSVEPVTIPNEGSAVVAQSPEPAVAPASPEGTPPQPAPTSPAPVSDGSSNCEDAYIAMLGPVTKGPR